MARNKNLKIALLDLNHMSRGIHTNTVPLGLGLISTYLCKTMGYDIDIRMFKEAQKAIKLLKSWVPDVVGLAQYLWNSELNLYISRLIKEINPDCLIVAGGPNLELSRSRREAFLKKERSIDICVAFDGEIPFTEIVKRLLSGESSYDIRKAPVAGSYSLDPVEEVLTESLALIPRLGSLDIFGAVYADGVFDELLNEGFHPFVQTHRGCPFTCAFCHTSDRYYSRMLFMSPEIFECDMEYLGKRFADKSDVTLYIANTNMGLFKGDFTIAEIIRKVQKRYNWPRLINVNSGRDPKKLLDMLSIINIRPTIALQTLTPDVLKNIKRKNIPFDEFVAFQDIVSQRTKEQSSTELILCLPGETKESFLNTLRPILNSNIHNIVIYTLMNLKGTPLSSEDNARRYGYKIRHRVVPRQFSLINGTKVLDTEEVIVATNTMSYEDYLDLRGLSFVVTVFFSSSELIPLKKFMHEYNIDVAQWVFDIHADIRGFREIHKAYQAFLQETEQELFSTREALIKFFDAPENFEALCEGQLGDNLLRKYKSVILSNYYEAFLELAISKVRKLARDDASEMLLDLKKYLSTRNMKKYLTDSYIDMTDSFHFKYNVHDWFNNNNGNLPLKDFSGSFDYIVKQTDYAKNEIKNIKQMNRDFELSLQILYRDGFIKNFWPAWIKE